MPFASRMASPRAAPIVGSPVGVVFCREASIAGCERGLHAAISHRLRAWQSECRDAPDSVRPYNRRMRGSLAVATYPRPSSEHAVHAARPVTRAQRQPSCAGKSPFRGREARAQQRATLPEGGLRIKSGWKCERRCRSLVRCDPGFARRAGEAGASADSVEY